jgi:hypothetical protein
MKRLLAIGLLVLGMVAASSVGMFSTGDSLIDPTPAFADAAECGGDTHLVVKLKPGKNIANINTKYNTVTVRSFPGTDIYVLEPVDAGANMARLERKIGRNKRGGSLLKVAQAIVSLRQNGDSISESSVDALGDFSIPDVAPGHYDLTVILENMEVVVKGIEV